MMPSKLRNISILGLGYVGLSTAVAFASKGFRVVGYDIDRRKVERINEGDPTFHDPGLEGLLRKALANSFEASDKPRSSDVNFITVGTPSLGDGAIDLSYVRSASESLGAALKDTDRYAIVAVKSTVTPGTTENVVKSIIESASGKFAGKEFGLVSNQAMAARASTAAARP